jgi:hypothetical protein
VIDRAEIDLEAEWRAATKAADWKALQWLLAKGVPAPALVSVGMLSFIVGTLQIKATQGRFEPRLGSQRAYVVPANERERLDDLVAWRPGSPTTFWRRTGTATLMGEAAIFEALETGEPLRLFATPFAWLKGGRGGFVILDWEARLPMFIDQVSAFLVDDMDLRRRLAHALERPRKIPPILVKRAALDGQQKQQQVAA